MRPQPASLAEAHDMVISHRLNLTIRPVEHTASSFADCSAGVLHPKQPGLLQRYLRAVRRTWLLQSPRWATPVLHTPCFAHGSGLRITRAGGGELRENCFV